MVWGPCRRFLFATDLLYKVLRRCVRRELPQFGRPERQARLGADAAHIHPTMPDEGSGVVRSLTKHWREWVGDYIYDRRTNEFSHKNFDDGAEERVEGWFKG